MWRDHPPTVADSLSESAIGPSSTQQSLSCSIGLQTPKIPISWILMASEGVIPNSQRPHPQYTEPKASNANVSVPDTVGHP